MAKTPAEFAAAQDLVDQYTNSIADRIVALVGQVQGGGLSDVEEAAVFDRIVAQAEALRPLGTVDNPPPPPVDPGV